MVYDGLATRISAEYNMLLFALSGRYHQVRAPGVEVTPKALTELMVDAYVLGSTFYSAAIGLIDAYLQPLLLDASDELVVEIESCLKRVKMQIVKMVNGNVRQIGKLARTGVSDYSSMLKSTHGATGLLVQKLVGTVQFRATDTSGRFWDSRTLMHTIVRDFAYQQWLNAQFDAILRDGIDLAVGYRFPDDYVLTFSITGDTSGYDKLADIRSTIFHPNSTTMVKQYVSS